MANAKQLVPGIHAMGQQMAWLCGVEPPSVSEARVIAEKVQHNQNILNELSAIRAEIDSLLEPKIRLRADWRGG